MKKQEQNSYKTRKSTGKDSAPPITKPVDKTSQNSKTKNLSLIFSKLAEFDDRRSDEDFFHIIGDDILDKSTSTSTITPTTSTVNLEEELAKLKAIISDDNNDSKDKLVRLKKLFQINIDSIKEIENKIAPSLIACRAAYKKKDVMILDSLGLKQDIDNSENSYKEKADMCRNLQSRNKEYEATSQLLLIEEAKKTEELRMKCDESISSITKQIEEEEIAVAAKKEENDCLAVKITEFNSHLLLRDEHVATQRKARAIEQQLLGAKRSQYLHSEEERRSNSESFRKHMLQLKEAEGVLSRDLALYVEKASTFEATLDDTKPVFLQFENRANLMMKEVDEIDEEIKKQNIAKAEKEMKLEKMKQYIISADLKLEEMKNNTFLAVKCRALQARRTQLTKEISVLNPPPPPSIQIESADIERVASGSSSGSSGSNVSDFNISPEKEDFLDDRPSDFIIDTKTGKTSPHSQIDSWIPSSLSSSSSGSGSRTPPSSSSRMYAESSTKENTTGGDTPVSSPQINSPKRTPEDEV